MNQNEVNIDDLIFHVGRHGQQIGKFSGKKLREGLFSGEILSTDMAWREGMVDWLPVKEAMAFGHDMEKPEGDVAAKMGEVVYLHGKMERSPWVKLPNRDDADGGHVGVGVMPMPTAAIVSLALGVIPLVFCPLGMILWLPGIICGHKAMAMIKSPGSRYEGKGVAIAGLILNYFWLVLALLLSLFLALIFLPFQAATVLQR